MKEQRFIAIKVRNLIALFIIIGILFLLNLITNIQLLDLAIKYDALKIKNNDLESINEIHTSIISDLQENCENLHKELEVK